jgi:hypothetical protein
MMPTMPPVKARTSAVFVRSFRIPGFDEELPPGEYLIETELHPPSGLPEPESWKASVLIHLHPKDASPALARTLTVPLADLERAEAEDRLSGRPLAEFLLDELLADPMVRLVMASDGVTEEEMRRLYSRRPPSPEAPDDR